MIVIATDKFEELNVMPQELNFIPQAGYRFAIEDSRFDVLGVASGNKYGVVFVNKDEGGGGIDNYNQLTNKPQVNGITLSGNKTSSQLKVQDKLVSGTNIKTINNQTLLGEGNINIEGGSGTIDTEMSPTSENAVQNKVITNYVDNVYQGIIQALDEGYQPILTEGDGIDISVSNQISVDNTVARKSELPDMNNFYDKTETDNLLNNKAELSIDYGDDAVSVSQGTNSFTLSPTTGGYELDISGTPVRVLADKNYVDSKLSDEEQIVGWTTITPNAYHEVDLRSALANNKKKFTILIYMRKGQNRQATKYELTITELNKLFQKTTTNELIITRMIMGIENTNRNAMLKQFVKQTYDTDSQLIPGLLQIKYQGYENNEVIGTFDNFEYMVYGE